MDGAVNPYSMVQELDKSFDALILVGYHSPAGSGGHPLAQTFRATIHFIELNGEQLSEFRVNSLTVRNKGIPTVFLSGDENLCEDASKAEPEIVTFATHRGIGDSTIGRNLIEGLQKIGDGVQRALARVKSIPIQTMPDEFKLKIRYLHPSDAYWSSFYPGVSLANDVTIEFEPQDWFEILRLIQFVR